MSNPTTNPSVCHCPQCGQAHYVGFGPDKVQALRESNAHLRTLLHSALAHVRGEGDDTLATLIKAELAKPRFVRER